MTLGADGLGVQDSVQVDSAVVDGVVLYVVKVLGLV